MTAEIFKQQFLPYTNKLYSVAFRILSSKDEAADAVQDTFVKLWDKRNELNLRNKEAFAVVLLKNICIDKIRKRKPQAGVATLDRIATERSVSRQIENYDSWAIMQNLIEKLPEQQKKVLKMWHLEENTIEEIEKKTGLNQINIRTILSRARKTLREQFEKINNYESKHY